MIYRDCSRNKKGGIGLKRKISFRLLLILFLCVAYLRKKLLKRTHAEEFSVDTNLKDDTLNGIVNISI